MKSSRVNYDYNVALDMLRGGLDAEIAALVVAKLSEQRRGPLVGQRKPSLDDRRSGERITQEGLWVEPLASSEVVDGK